VVAVVVVARPPSCLPATDVAAPSPVSTCSADPPPPASEEEE
jgi:hypothetical protein